MKLKALIFFLIFSATIVSAQYRFSGELQQNSGYTKAYLSLVEDYRKVYGVYEEQIINTVAIENDSFVFTGSNLEVNNRIYRIHIDNCSDGLEKGHFNGQCDASRSILFVANTNDVIHFPISFENQLLCIIEAKKDYISSLSKIDSLKELMTYDYLSYRSEANKRINNKNWFNKLHQFGESLNEPLAELYSYQFLSDRSSEFYDYYLEDLKTTEYYNQLLARLKKQYPDAVFTKQYELELAADNYRVELSKGGSFRFFPWLLALLIFGLLTGVAFKLSKKKPKKQLSTNSLTQQEQKVLNLILENKTNKEIAQEIFVSVSTVKTHTNNLYKKLNVTSRDQVKSLFKS